MQCKIRGCRRLQTRCSDCDRLVSEAIFPNSYISIEKEKPTDDQTVLVINEKVQMLPIKAYYSEEWNEFLSLESYGTQPLSITHWMLLPSSPEKQDS